MNIPWKNLQPFTVEGHAPANGRIITKIIPTAGRKISGQITIQMDQMKISKFNYQEKPISFYHLDHGQLERSFGHNSGEFLRQLLSQDLSSIRKQMALLKQPQLVATSQPSGQYHLLTGWSPIKRDEEANEQRPLGQTAQR